MGKTELTIFIFLAFAIGLIFIIGTILFINQYRKRKIVFETEKAEIKKQHIGELHETQVQMQQETMEKIGREIHDSVLQKIGLASISTQKLELEASENQMIDKLRMISTLLKDSLIELRELSKRLTYFEFQHKTLTELLQRECEKVNVAGICTASLQGSYDKDINIDIKKSLFRVMQEFIQNSLKHSACSSIKIELEEYPAGLRIFAADDGKGFDKGGLISKGIGLDNMQGRVNAIGGDFKLESEPNKGTRLELLIPSEILNSVYK